MLCWCRRLCTSSDSTWCQQRAVLFTRGFDWQIPSSSRCTSQLNQASADNNDHDNYKAQGDEQIHPMCYVGRVNSWYQRPAKTLIVKPFLHKFCQMYIMGCYCWDLWLLPDWMLVCYMVTALQHIYYCRCTGDVSTRQQETNFWNQFREWWIKNSNHTCPRLCKILAKEKGKCLINVLK